MLSATVFTSHDNGAWPDKIMLTYIKISNNEART